MVAVKPRDEPVSIMSMEERSFKDATIWFNEFKLVLLVVLLLLVLLVLLVVLLLVDVYS